MLKALYSKKKRAGLEQQSNGHITPDVSWTQDDRAIKSSQDYSEEAFPDPSSLFSLNSYDQYSKLDVKDITQQTTELCTAFNVAIPQNLLQLVQQVLKVGKQYISSDQDDRYSRSLRSGSEIVIVPQRFCSQDVGKKGHKACTLVDTASGVTTLKIKGKFSIYHLAVFVGNELGYVLHQISQLALSSQQYQQYVLDADNNNCRYSTLDLLILSDLNKKSTVDDAYNQMALQLIGTVTAVSINQQVILFDSLGGSIRGSTLQLAVLHGCSDSVIQHFLSKGASTSRRCSIATNRMADLQTQPETARTLGTSFWISCTTLQVFCVTGQLWAQKQSAALLARKLRSESDVYKESTGALEIAVAYCCNEVGESIVWEIMEHEPVTMSTLVAALCNPTITSSPTQSIYRAIVTALSAGPATMSCEQQEAITRVLLLHVLLGHDRLAQRLLSDNILSWHTDHEIQLQPFLQSVHATLAYVGIDFCDASLTALTPGQGPAKALDTQAPPGELHITEKLQQMQKYLHQLTSCGRMYTQQHMCLSYLLLTKLHAARDSKRIAQQNEHQALWNALLDQQPLQSLQIVCADGQCKSSLLHYVLATGTPEDFQVYTGIVRSTLDAHNVEPCSRRSVQAWSRISGDTTKSSDSGVGLELRALLQQQCFVVPNPDSTIATDSALGGATAVSHGTHGGVGGFSPALSQSPLELVLSRQDLSPERLQQFLYHLGTAGFDLSRYSTEGTQRSPLHVANTPRSLLAVASLGANPNLCDVHGDTPLHTHIKAGNVAAASTMLTLPRVQIDTRNSAGETPIQLALQQLADLHKAIGMAEPNAQRYASDDFQNGAAMDSGKGSVGSVYHDAASLASQSVGKSSPTTAMASPLTSGNISQRTAYRPPRLGSTNIHKSIEQWRYLIIKLLEMGANPISALKNGGASTLIARDLLVHDYNYDSAHGADEVDAQGTGKDKAASFGWRRSPSHSSTCDESKPTWLSKVQKVRVLKSLTRKRSTSPLGRPRQPPDTRVSDTTGALAHSAPNLLPHSSLARSRTYDATGERDVQSTTNASSKRKLSHSLKSMSGYFSPWRTKSLTHDTEDSQVYGSATSSAMRVQQQPPQRNKTPNVEAAGTSATTGNVNSTTKPYSLAQQVSVPSQSKDQSRTSARKKVWKSLKSAIGAKRGATQGAQGSGQPLDKPILSEPDSPILMAPIPAVPEPLISKPGTPIRLPNGASDMEPESTKANGLRPSNLSSAAQAGVATKDSTSTGTTSLYSNDRDCKDISSDSLPMVHSRTTGSSQNASVQDADTSVGGPHTLRDDIATVLISADPATAPDAAAEKNDAAPAKRERLISDDSCEAEPTWLLGPRSGTVLPDVTTGESGDQRTSSAQRPSRLPDQTGSSSGAFNSALASKPESLKREAVVKLGEEGDEVLGSDNDLIDSWRQNCVNVVDVVAGKKASVSKGGQEQSQPKGAGSSSSDAQPGVLSMMSSTDRQSWSSVKAKGGKGYSVGSETSTSSVSESSQRVRDRPVRTSSSQYSANATRRSGSKRESSKPAVPRLSAKAKQETAQATSNASSTATATPAASVSASNTSATPTPATSAAASASASPSRTSTLTAATKSSMNKQRSSATNYGSPQPTPKSGKSSSASPPLPSKIPTKQRTTPSSRRQSAPEGQGLVSSTSDKSQPHRERSVSDPGSGQAKAKRGGRGGGGRGRRQPEQQNRFVLEGQWGAALWIPNTPHKEEDGSDSTIKKQPVITEQEWLERKGQVKPNAQGFPGWDTLPGRENVEQAQRQVEQQAQSKQRDESHGYKVVGVQPQVVGASGYQDTTGQYSDVEEGVPPVSVFAGSMAGKGQGEAGNIAEQQQGRVHSTADNGLVGEPSAGSSAVQYRTSQQVESTDESRNGAEALYDSSEDLMYEDVDSGDGSVPQYSNPNAAHLMEALETYEDPQYNSLIYSPPLLPTIFEHDKDASPKQKSVAKGARLVQQAAATPPPAQQPEPAPTPAPSPTPAPAPAPLAGSTGSSKANNMKLSIQGLNHKTNGALEAGSTNNSPPPVPSIQAAYPPLSDNEALYSNENTNNVDSARSTDDARYGGISDKDIDNEQVRILVGEAVGWLPSGDGLLHNLNDGDEMVIQVAIMEGMQLDGKDENGNTPLLAASFAGQVSICRMLLMRGADVQARNVNSDTALHMLFYAPHLTEAARSELARSLMNAGLVADSPNAQGLTALHLAHTSGCWQLFSTMNEHANKAASRRMAAERRKSGAGPKKTKKSSRLQQVLS